MMMFEIAQTRSRSTVKQNADEGGTSGFWFNIDPHHTLYFRSGKWRLGKPMTLVKQLTR